MATSSTARKAPLLRRILRSPLLHPLNDGRAWDGLLQRVDARASLREVRARIVERIDEDADTVSLWLAPNRRWRGHLAGQHVAVGIEIDGVLRWRSFSLSAAPRADRRLRLTIRRNGEGGVSDWIVRHAQAGMVWTLSQAQGDFQLPQSLPPALLLVGAGSGMTPILALLEALAARRYAGAVHLLQLARDPASALFAAELTALREALPGLEHRLHLSSHEGRWTIDDPLLQPLLVARPTWVCGPPGLLDALLARHAAIGRAALQHERFAAPAPARAPDAPLAVRCTTSEQSFTVVDGRSLLDAAEAAGLTPAAGCRRGLCRTCLCRKQHGTVRNLLTGHASSEPDEWIQLCISAPESDLEIAL
jgi:stearoyl-CoA 9-desaturase NADPH oxidoreductase